MSQVDSESAAPGETPQFVGVREQRVTGVCVFILTGLSVKLAPILKYIPMPVLYGVLMFMGVNTLRGMQFIDRCMLFLMPAKHQPDTMYLRHVPLKKVGKVRREKKLQFQFCEKYFPFPKIFRNW